MKQPERFTTEDEEDLVCKLKKSLYGFKQATRQWYKKFDSFMVDHGYTKTSSDHCVFMKKFFNGEFIILLLYVDDMLIIGHDTKKIGDLKKELSKPFAMKDLGSAKQILGMKIIHDRKNGKLWLSQQKYIEKVLEKFNMGNAKPVGTPLADANMASDVDSRKSTSRERALLDEKIPIRTRPQSREVPLDKKQFSLEKIHTNDNGSDMMTKTLPMGKFATCRMKVGMVEYGPISS
ncbi:hypothetical protein L6164_023534 [Bauhinia variegata]|nr:hypothetical protein L6164_023524 [Bauhinia variegata]KAI4323964.1 hypothetical protein L6164_023534 [Bauhinia variegata]